MIIAINESKKDLILKNRYGVILYVNVDSKININQVKEEIEQIRQNCIENNLSYVVEYRENIEGSFYRYFGGLFEIVI